MDEKLESGSFLNLLRSDSGVALTSMDAIVRETELQQRQLDIEDKEIEDIRERLEHLEDVVQNSIIQLEELRQRKELPSTNWMRNLISENREMTERLALALSDKKQLDYECFVMANRLKEKEQELGALNEKHFESKQKDMPLEEAMEGNSSLNKSLLEENIRLKEVVKLLSMENQELGKKGSLLANDVEAKTTEVNILEMRIKNLESQVEDNLVIDLDEKDDDEKTLTGEEEWEMQNVEEVNEGNSDGGSVILEFHQNEWGEKTNLQDYSNQVEELELMQGFFVKIAKHLNIDEDIDSQDGYGVVGRKFKMFQDVESKILDIKKDNEDLKEETKELKSLVEFLEFEQKFTKEDSEQSKEVNIKLKSKLQEAVENEKEMQGQLSTWSQMCGKLFATVKKTEQKAKAMRSMERRTIVAAKRVQRKRLEKKFKGIRAKLAACVAKGNIAKSCIDALAGKNLELELQVDLLQCNNEEIRKQKDELEKAYKHEMQDNMRMLDEVEGLREEADKAKSFRTALNVQRKELDSVKCEHFTLLKEFEEKKVLHANCQRKLKVALICKEMIQKRLEKEEKGYEECERKLIESKTDMANVQEKFQDDIQAILEEVRVLQEKKEEDLKDLEGEMEMRFMYETKLEEYISEKKKLEVILENAIEKNQEAENIICALHQIIEKKKKPKRSRFARFFRRESE
eukprot:gene5144-270_t